MPRNANRKKAFKNEEDKGIRMDNRYGGGEEEFNESEEEKEEQNFLEDDNEEKVNDLLDVRKSLYFDN
jgi:hypothetical protein